jgi:uncharacterized protein YhdP
MKSFLQRLLKYLAYLAAGVVILLAVAVGLFRLLLPRLPEYQDEIKAWAGTGETGQPRPRAGSLQPPPGRRDT